MKYFVLAYALLISLSIHAQDISGSWYGMLKVQGIQLRLIFNIAESDGVYSSTMDSPDQGAKGMPVSSTKYRDSVLTMKVEAVGIKYKGTLNDEHVFVGILEQAGQSFSLNLDKGKINGIIVGRTQEPNPPYPYYTEEVKFENRKDSITLAGTLSLPNKNGIFPGVILISGSGPQNRDEEAFGHKPFLVLADYLTKHGIAVLRFDDRGTGRSTGTFKGATTYDFVTDVESAIAFLQNRGEINNDKIGLIGHSEGGVIAPIVASKNDGLDYIVLMAGPALRGDELLLLQKYKIEMQMGISKEAIGLGQKIFAGAYEIIVDKSIKEGSLADTLSNYFLAEHGSTITKVVRKGIVDLFVSPWMVAFIRLDPAVYLEKVSCPVLALFGGKDLQVPAKENLEKLDNIIRNSQSSNFTTIELDDLNHLFQECKTGAIDEYNSINQTISPIALEFITNWMMKQ